VSAKKTPDGFDESFPSDDADRNHSSKPEAHDYPPCRFGQGEYTEDWWPETPFNGKSFVVIGTLTVLPWAAIVAFVCWMLW